MSDRPAWAEWNAAGTRYTLGVEEEIMLLHPGLWSLAPASAPVLEALRDSLAARVQPETHNAVVETGTAPHTTVGAAAQELGDMRAAIAEGIAPLELRAAVAGTHPFASWQETRISEGERYELVYGSMRELARREPTFALHVHVGVPDPEDAVRLFNRIRAHLPLLLALSANSPFWQGRDTGLASARTPLFQAFPRVGIPRPFHSYDEYVEAIDVLIACEALPEPTFLWWDVRLQPKLGTVETRIMDAQTSLTDVAALTALVQCLAALELEEGWAPEAQIHAPEVLDENRFLAARDGTAARLVDAHSRSRIPALELLAGLLKALRPYAEKLNCPDELEGLRALAERPGATRQLEWARGEARLKGLVADLADAFVPVSSTA